MHYRHNNFSLAQANTIVPTFLYVTALVNQKG